MHLETLDFAVVAIYAISLLLLAQWVSREKAGHQKDTQDYFLAGRALPWWAIGDSLIAANISAEQIIGMSGSAFVLGIAIGAYEWMAAITLIIVGKYLLPVFLEHRIYTMPQFLEQRFDARVKTILGLFWLGVYVFVNLTSILWLGALAIHTVTGMDQVIAIALLAAFAAGYSLYGGLKAVALTDIIQVVILILGGLAITWIALDRLPGADGAIGGLGMLMEQMPGHFEMILDRSHAAYGDLPGIWTLLGGLWVLHFSYWGFNQYIIQRALGAKSLAEAQKGLAFAAGLKLLIPLIVVVPGIAALYLAQQGTLDQATLAASPDSTYGVLMGLVPAGFRGLVFAALIAAVVSSLGSMMNSISTIFTMDIYRSFRPEQSQHHYVTVGRFTAFSAMAIALVLAQPFLGGFESAFQTIQEYTGFIAPGVVAVFLLGFFWKRANTQGAFALLISSVALSVAAKVGLPDLPFVIRIWVVFLACLAIGVLVSLATPKPEEERTVDLKDVGFKTRAGFNIAGIAIIIILALIYVAFW